MELWLPFFEFLFQFWIILQNYLIGRLPVAMATVKKIRSHSSMRNVHTYLPPKYEYHSTYGYWVTSTPVFSQSEAVYGYHGNQMKIIHWFWKFVTWATIWYIIHMCHILGKMCNLVWKMGPETVTPPLNLFRGLIIVGYLRYHKMSYHCYYSLIYFTNLPSGKSGIEHISCRRAGMRPVFEMIRRPHLNRQNQTWRGKLPHSP